MNLPFEEKKIKNSINKEKHYAYIEDLVLLAREVQDNGIIAFESEKWENSTVYEQIAIDLLCEGCPPDRLEFILTNLLNTSDFIEDEYIRAVLFRAFAIFVQKGGICEMDMRKLLLSYFGVQAYHNKINNV